MGVIIIPHGLIPLFLHQERKRCKRYHKTESKNKRPHSLKLEGMNTNLWVVVLVVRAIHSKSVYHMSQKNHKFLKKKTNISYLCQRRRHQRNKKETMEN